MSGHGPDLTRDDTAAVLSKTVPVLQSLKVRFPNNFNSVVDDYYESILKGRTEAETTDLVRAKAVSVYFKTSSARRRRCARRLQQGDD